MAAIRGFWVLNSAKRGDVTPANLYPYVIVKVIVFAQGATDPVPDNQGLGYVAGFGE
jgi:hypothetical protein